MKCTGARIVIECLLEQGVKVVFGYPGGAILNIYDELYKNKATPFAPIEDLYEKTHSWYEY